MGSHSDHDTGKAGPSAVAVTAMGQYRRRLARMVEKVPSGPAKG
jgi:hypothetical protein